MPASDRAAAPDKTLDDRLAEAEALKAARSWDACRAMLDRISQDFPDSALVALRLAQLARDSGRLAEVPAHAARAARLEPGRVWLSAHAIDMLIAGGFHDAADTVLADLPDGAEAAVDITLRRAKLANLRSDFTRTLALTETGLARHPEHAGLLTLQATALLGLDRTAEARAVLTGLAARGEAETYSYVLLGQMIQDSGDPDQALPHFRAAMDKNPDLVLPFQRLAQVLADQGRLAELRAEAIDRHTRSPRALGTIWMRAHAHRLAQEPDAALALLEPLPEARQAYMTLLSLKADILADQGRIHAAMLLLQDAAAAWPDAAQPLIRLATLYQDLGQPAVALHTLEDAETRDPSNWRLQSQKATVLRGLGRDAEALAALDRAWALQPSEVSLRIQKAHWLNADGRKKEALAATDDVLARQPAHLSCLYARARIFMDLGRTLEAKAEMDRAMTTDAPTPSQLLTLARGMKMVGEPERELELLERVVRQAPHDPELRRVLVRRSFDSADPKSVYAHVSKRLPEAGQLFQDSYGTYMLETGLFRDALAHLRRHARSPRDSSHAYRIARALIGLNRYKTACRYIHLCRRRWPAMRIFFDLEFLFLRRTGNALDGSDGFARAHAAMTAEIETNGAFAQIAAINRGILLYWERRFAEADALFESERGNPYIQHLAWVMQFRHLVTIGTFPRIQAALPDLIEHHSFYREEHWRVISLHGGFFNELSSNTELQSDTELDFDALRLQMQKNPGSTAVATRLIDRAMAEGRLGAPGVGAGPDTIPKTIYQYWDLEPVPEQVEDLMTSWSDLPGYDRQLYSKDRALKLLRSEFGPRWVLAFRLTRNPAEEADLLRLCLLSMYGGIWADADDSLVGNLDALLAGAPGMVLYREAIESALGNNFIAARPGHPVIMRAARLAQRALLQRSRENVWFKTGPGLMTRAVAQILASDDPKAVTDDIRILEQHRIFRDIIMHHPVTYKRSSTHWSSGRRNNPRYFDLLRQCLDVGSRTVTDPVR